MIDAVTRAIATKLKGTEYFRTWGVAPFPDLPERVQSASPKNLFIAYEGSTDADETSASTQRATAWSVTVVAVGLLLVGALLKYLVPGRRLTEAGVPTRTLWSGAALGIVGFFVIPVVGLLVGFVMGVYAAERVRVGGGEAGRSTVAALRAVGLSLAIELLAALLAAATWAVGVVLT